MRTRIKQFSTIITAVFFLVIAIATGQKEAEKEVSKKVSSAPPIPVASTVLYSDYEANGVAADEKYKDKVLDISGKVLSIDKNSIDKSEIIVRLNGLVDNEYEILGISCYFDESHKSEAASLSKGQKVTIRGLCDGKLIGVNIKGCSLVK